MAENWINDLNEFKLKNYGANRNQTHLVYFNKSLVENRNNWPNSSFTPNFNATLVDDVDGITVDECCFYATIVKFWRKYFFLFLFLLNLGKLKFVLHCATSILSCSRVCGVCTCKMLEIYLVKIAIGH